MKRTLIFLLTALMAIAYCQAQAIRQGGKAIRSACGAAKASTKGVRVLELNTRQATAAARGVEWQTRKTTESIRKIGPQTRLTPQVFPKIEVPRVAKVERKKFSIDDLFDVDNDTADTNRQTIPTLRMYVLPRVDLNLQPVQLPDITVAQMPEHQPLACDLDSCSCASCEEEITPPAEIQE